MLKLEKHRERISSVMFDPSLMNADVFISSSIDNEKFYCDCRDYSKVKVRGIPGFKGHENQVTLIVSLNKMDAFLTASNNDGIIFLWNLKKGAIIDKIMEFEAHQDGISSLIADENCKWLISIGGIKDHFIKFWDIQQDFKLIYKEKLEESFYKLEMNCNNKTFANVGNNQDYISIWDINNRKVSNKLRAKQGENFSSLCFINQEILAAANGFRIILWNVATEKNSPKGILYELIGHSYEIIKIVKKNKNLASLDKNGFVIIWDLFEGEKPKKIKEIQTFFGKEIISDINFIISNNNSKINNKLLINSIVNNKILIWDFENEKEEDIKEYFISGIISTVAVSNNNMLLGFNDNTIELCEFNEINNENILYKMQEFPNFDNHKKDINCLALSTDGELLYTGANDSKIIIWDLSLKTKIISLKANKGGVLSICLMKNNKALFSAGNDNSIIIWNLKNILLKTTTNCLNEIISIDKTHSEPITSLLLLKRHISKHSSLISGSLDKKVIFWNLIEENQQIKNIEIFKVFSYNFEILSLAYNCSNTIAIGGINSIIIININKLIQVREFTNLEQNIISLEFNPINTKILASVGNDSKIILWDLFNGEKIQQLKRSGNTYAINSIQFTANNYHKNCLFSVGGNDSKILIWDLLTGEIILEVETQAEGNSFKRIILSIDKKKLIAVGSSKQIYIWRIPQMGEFLKKVKKHKKKVTSLEFSPINGNFIVSSSSEDPLIDIWNFNGIFINSIKENKKGEGIPLIKITPDEKFVVSFNSVNKKIKFWDIENKKKTKTDIFSSFEIENCPDKISKMDFYYSEKKKLFLFCYKQIIIWDINTQKFIKHLIGGHNKIITTAIFVKKGQKIVSAGEDSCVFLWNLKTAKFKLIYFANGSKISCMEKNVHNEEEDQCLLAIGGANKKIVLYNLDLKKTIGELKGHERSISCLAFNGKGNLLISGAEDKLVIIWGVQNCERFKTLSFCQANINSLSINPSNNSIIIACDYFSDVLQAT